MKTIIKYFDWAGQTILLLSALIVIGFSFRDVDSLFTLLWIQLIIGPWQIMSAVIWIVWRMPYAPQRKRYLMIASAWCVGLFALIQMQIARDQILVLIVLIVVPWILAIYYYRITTQSVFQATPSKGFLPHLNF